MNAAFRSTLKLCLATVLTVLLLAACASPPAPPSGFISYQMIDSSAQQKPTWTHNVPEEAGKQIFIGQSNYYSTEQEARSDALRDAIKKYADFLGVEVSAFDETLRQLEGSESAIQDAQVSRKSRTTLQTNARASRAKARKWYTEKYNAMDGGQVTGIAYSAWVEVTVPNSEIESYQEERRQKKQRIADQKKQVYQEALSEAEATVASVNIAQKEALRATQNGDILSALSGLDFAQQDLTKARYKFLAAGGRIASLASKFDRPATEIKNLTYQLQNSVTLDVGRFNNYCLKDQSGCEKISVWAWSRQGQKSYPLSNLPLVLTGEGDGSRFAARTNSQGKATFQLSRIMDSSYIVKVDEKLIGIDRELVGNLLAANNRVYIQSQTPSLERLIDQGVKDLFQGATPEPLPVDSLILGAVTYENSPEGGEFALLVKDLLGQSLTSINGLRVVTPRKHSASELTNVMQTRGISARASGVGDGAMQAQLNNAGAALQANYRKFGNDTQLTLALLRAESGQLLRKTMLAVPSRLLPSSTQVTSTPPVENTPPPPPQQQQDIRLDVTSHLGDGQTYQEGDTISYFVSSNQDAYLLLIYQDAGGNLIQILPNSYSGNEKFRSGNYIEVPRSSDNYEFIIEGPFGVEHVWAFASDRPLPRLPGQDVGNGLTLLNGSLDSILSTVRSVASQPGISYGEARATITTVARR
ncbi:MAG: hypothetical protein C0624_00530 [Desulfuromonas sp.]|nr:MAG: hypothetical protein C0624_00530 [Desulfuromonas sp.]